MARAIFPTSLEVAREVDPTVLGPIISTAIPADPPAVPAAISTYSKLVGPVAHLFAEDSAGVVYDLMLASGGGTGFSADRTLYVSGAWPGSASATVYFTTISAALAQAATMTPTAASPVLIQIYPGTYVDPLDLVSNVHLSARARRDVIITGAVTWTAGAGVNAPQAAVREEVDLSYIVMTSTFTIDTTAKTAGNGVLDARESAFRGGGSYLARVGQIDYWQVWNAVMFGAPWTFTDTNTNIFTSSTDALTFAGNAAIDIRASEIFGVTTIGGTSSGSIEGTQLNGAVSIAAGCSVDFTGSRFMAGSILTVAVGGSADVRMAEILVLANLVGAGRIDRSIWRMLVGPTLLGINNVILAPVYIDALYNVTVTQIAGAVGVPPLIGAKTAGTFILTETVPGRTFDVTILKE